MNWIATFVGLMLLVVVLFALIFFLFDLLGVLVDLAHMGINWLTDKINGKRDDI